MLAVREIFGALLIRIAVQQRYQAQKPFVLELISASQWDAHSEHSEASLGIKLDLLRYIIDTGDDQHTFHEYILLDPVFDAL